MTQPFIGEIQLFGFNFAPRQWAFCQGQLLPISQNTALFSLLGTAYGGDGKVSFGLPDFRDRAACGTGQGPGLSPRVVGESFGVDTVTLIQAQIPSHTHSINMFVQNDPGKKSGTPAAGDGLTAPDTPAFADPDALQPFANSLGPGGGDQPHENRQPYLAMNFCIALAGIFPSRP